MINVTDEFRSHLADCGIVTHDKLIADGKIHRAHVDGDKPRSTNLVYVLHADGVPNGRAWGHKLGVETKWLSKRENAMTAEERKTLAAQMREAQLLREEELRRSYEEASARATWIWECAKPAEQHPYLTRKAVKSYGLRVGDFYGHSGALLIPVMESKSKISSIQAIFPSKVNGFESDRLFLKGGRKSGGYFVIGQPSSTVVFCEGYATGASIHEATGFMCVVCFDAGNLPKVAEKMKNKIVSSGMGVIIAADNDCYGNGNTGMRYASDASLVFGSPVAHVIAPKFKSTATKPTDFNDLHVLEGIDEVRRQILREPDPTPPPEPEPEETPNALTTNDLLAYIAERNGLLGKAGRDSRVMADAMREHYLFDEAFREWYRFDRIWRPASEGEIKRLVIDALDEMRAGDYQSSAVSGLLDLLRTRLGRHPYLSEDADAVLDCWNRDRNLLPMKNGVLNIRTRQLIPHAPELLMNWCVPRTYDPDAECPETDRFIMSLAQGDPNVKHMLFCFLAAVLRGRSDLQKYLELVGKPGTGKSTYLKLATELVGRDNAVSTSMQHLHENRFETANLYGKRLAIITDADKYGGSVEVFKAVTGQDPLRREEKNRQHAPSFIFGGMVILAANQPVQFSDTSTAMMRRRVPHHVEQSIDDVKRDTGLFDRLAAEVPGLINRLLDIDDATIEAVLTDSERIHVGAVRRALTETNSVADWADERLILSDHARTKVGDLSSDGSCLYRNYADWVASTGRKGVLHLRSFSNSLTEVMHACGHKLVSKKRLASGVHIDGVRLRTSSDDHVPTCLTGQVFEADLPDYDGAEEAF